MGGWLTPNASAASPSVAGFSFEFDENGRVIAPIFPEFDRVEFATFEQKRIALAWSQLWQRIEGKIDYLAAAVDLGLSLSGNLRRKDNIEAERLIVLEASLLLYRAYHRNAAQRTARAFPWLEFIVIDAYSPCQRALSLAGRLFPQDHAPQTPLAGCDSQKCACTFLQRTDGQRVRKGYTERDSDGWRKSAQTLD